MTDEQEHPTDESTERAEHTAAARQDDLTAPMQRTDGPGADVLRNREAQMAQNEMERARWEHAIDANIAPHRLALDHLDETHQWIADTYDFELAGDSRQAATWQMAGRCIGIARLMCDALALGYTAEVLHLARTLHEADGLVGVFAWRRGPSCCGSGSQTRVTSGCARGRTSRAGAVRDATSRDGA